MKEIKKIINNRFKDNARYRKSYMTEDFEALSILDK